MNLILLMGILTTVAFVSQTTALSDKNDIDNKTPSVVSRLDPVLRKALLQALSNLERSTEDESGESETTTVPTFNEEILEESTTSDQTPAVQYHSFVVQNNDTAANNDDSEIIQTIIVKAPRPTASSLDVDEVSEQSDNDVIIKFDKLDPVKSSDIRVETVQVARSVSSSIKTNEINGETDDDENQKQSTKPLKKVTTYKPTTTTTTTTTTEAPTHNEDGENIERVKENDVKIYQAPLVTAFTIQQDSFGLPKNVIPLFKQDVVPASMGLPVEQFSFTSNPSTQNFQNVPVQSNRNTLPPPQFSVQTSVQPQPPVFNGNTFALEQKQRELERQIVFLQEQQRKQEVLFRQQQSYQDQQALQRQAQLLLEQRLRIEEDYRLRQQKYEDELKAYKEKQNQQLTSRFNQPSVVVEGTTTNNQVAANAATSQIDQTKIDIQQQQLSVQQLPTQQQLSTQQQLPAQQQLPVQQQLPAQQQFPVQQQLPVEQQPQQFAPQTNQQNVQVQHQTITEVQNQQNQQLNVQPIQQQPSQVQNQQDIERQRQELQREIARQNEEYHHKQIKYQEDLKAYRLKQQQYEQQQQQSQQQLFSRQQLPFLPAQQFAPPVPQQQIFNQGLPQQQQQVRFNNNNNQNQNQNQFRTNVQIVPSVQFQSFQVPTQQMLPIREPQTFRSRSHNEFQQQTNIPQLSPVQELPQRSFQQFHSGPIIQNSNIDPVIAAPPDSIQRNRVFRQETDTANFFNSVNNNRITLNPVNNNADNYLQSLLFQSGISGRQNEDLNIITKVLALNHGIQSSPNDQQQIRFPRRENV